jgi:hypothetical protein
MSAIVMVLALAGLLGGLARYARHDRFSGPTSHTGRADDFGPIGNPHLHRF